MKWVFVVLIMIIMQIIEKVTVKILKLPGDTYSIALVMLAGYVAATIITYILADEA